MKLDFLSHRDNVISNEGIQRYASWNITGVKKRHSAFLWRAALALEFSLLVFSSFRKSIVTSTGPRFARVDSLRYLTKTRPSESSRSRGQCSRKAEGPSWMWSIFRASHKVKHWLALGGSPLHFLRRSLYVEIVVSGNISFHFCFVCMFLVISRVHRKEMRTAWK